MSLVSLAAVVGQTGLMIDGDWVESKDQDPNGQVRLTQLADIGVGVFLDKSARYMNAATAKRLSCTFLKKNDILVARMPDPIGRACIFPGSHQPCVTVVDVCIIRPDPTVADFRYLNWTINSVEFQNRLHQHIKGSTRQRISRKNLEIIPIPLPPLKEQKRIAAILDQVEELRRARRQALARLGTFTEALFEEVFGEDGRASTSTQRERLGAHLSFVTSGGRGWAKFYATAGARFLRSLDVQMNSIGEEDVVFVTPPRNAEARRTEVAAGDVLLTITGSRIGRVAAVPAQLAGSYVSQHVAILRPKASILSRFLAFYMSQRGGQQQIAKAQYGQTKPGLNFDQIKDFMVPIPPVNLQKWFVDRAEEIETLTICQRAHLAKLDALFASQQHRALYGELRSGRATTELQLAG